jgi:nucleotide-binding universal stress UspA family protein
MSMPQVRHHPDPGPLRPGCVKHRQVVVAGVDGSLEAAEAAQYAALAADARGLDLLVVHAFSPPPGSTCGVDSFAAEAAQRVTDDALTQIRMPVGLQVHTEVESTTPGALLLRLSHSAALLMLGQHVLNIADQLVEGSVAGPLAVLADCPVVVVPRGWSRATRRARTVAVALDGTSSAEAVLDFAFTEAERQQSPVVALHAMAQGGAAGSVDAAVRDLEKILAAAKESHPDMTLSVRLVAGDVGQAILDASQDVRLMVVGRPRRIGLGAKGRPSVIEAVLPAAQCPLAVVG